MNFLSHGIPYFDEPLVVAGTAVPDWLSVVDRKKRARSRLAQPFLESPDVALRMVALGIVNHHRDDNWFHGTRAFAELNLQFAIELRELLPGDDGFRPTFVGHILIEVILDRLWIEEDPRWASQYYEILAAIDPVVVGASVSKVIGQPVDELPDLIRRFIQARFLYDYLQTDTLLVRLNQVMRRVKLADLPPAVAQWLPRAVMLVQRRRAELLTPPDAASPFPLNL